MFAKNNKLPKLVEFEIKTEDFLADIEAVSKDEEERRKLYLCIDNKMPKTDPRLAKMEDMLKGNDALEKSLVLLEEKLEQLKQDQQLLEKSEKEVMHLLSN